MTEPLDPFSEVVDEQRRWSPEWYSWLREISQAITTAITDLLTVATDAEAQAGVSTTKALTPSNLPAVLGRGRFHVTFGGNDQAGNTGGTFNKLSFDTEALDSAAWYSMSQIKYIPQEAGWYWIYLSVGLKPLVSAETTQPIIRKNGLNVAAGFFATNVGTVSGGHFIATLVQMNGTTDFIEGFGWCPTGITVIEGSPSISYMGGWKVGT